MNKFLLTAFTLLLMCFVPAFGQDVSFSPVTDVSALQRAVRQQSEATQTLSSLFVQEKYLDMLQDVLVSNGRFMYKKENSVRWEYTDPIRYTILIHDGKFTIDNDGKISEFSTQSNPMFREINKMIVTAIRGDFVGSPDFSPTYFENEEQVMARLVPASAQVRSMIEYIEIYFQKSDMQVVKVLFAEPGGDYTAIRFTDNQVNREIPDSEFLH
jgi:outer membrane lipoprotein-sorting protein